MNRVAERIYRSVLSDSGTAQPFVLCAFLELTLNYVSSAGIPLADAVASENLSSNVEPPVSSARSSRRSSAKQSVYPAYAAPAMLQRVLPSPVFGSAAVL
jgi:hypothetical protein